MKGLKLNIVIREKDKQIAILVAFFMIIALDLIFILGWQWRSLSSNYKNASEKKQIINSLEIDLRNLDGYNNEILGLDEKISKLKLSIIDEVDISALIENISNLADSSGVKITQIKPVFEASESKYVEAKDSKFAEVEIQIIAKSDFHQLGSFISKIESAKNFLKVYSFDITTDNRNYFVQNIALSLKSFVNLKK
ncbi:type 4a pilus biogenesis protein PilO [Candidatus Omnitrophota bacterium]